MSERQTARIKKMMKSIHEIKNSRVLYITTKNTDYLRVTQEVRLLQEAGNTVTLIGSSEKSYRKRLCTVYRALLSVRMEDYDISMVGFAPQLVLPLFGRKLQKKPLVIDFFISFYDTLCMDRKKFRPQSIPGKMLHRLDRRTLQRADLAICDTHAHGQYFCEEFSYPSAQMQTLYLEADTSIYYPRPMQPHTDFTVLYFGSILPLQGVPVILEAISLLEQEPHLHMIMVGPLGDGAVLRNFGGMSAVRITDQYCPEPTPTYIDCLPQQQLAERIAQADLCLAGHFDGTIQKARRTIPGKAYIYHAMQKPMILGDNPATHELYQASEDGIYFVEMGNARALADLILQIKHQKEQQNEKSG